MQPNLNRIKADAAGHLGWQQRTTRHASPLASLRELRSSPTRLEALSPFLQCDGSLPPARLLAELRSVLQTAREAICDDFAISGDGPLAARQHSDLIDALVRHLLELAARRASPAVSKAQDGQFAVAAVGGYGRAELAPRSDIDLLFVVPEQPSAHSVQAIEFVLYRLWDLGLQVGHAVRSVGECVNLARSDWRTGISLLDLRFLWGRRALYDQLAGRFRTEIASDGEALVDALLCDLARRHVQFQDPAAPDVKRGRGGLRDMQTLLWLGKIRAQARPAVPALNLGFLEAADYSGHAAAIQFLWSVRCHLHYLTGRAEERLSIDLQPKIARRMLWDEPPERRSSAALMRQFWRATKRIEDLSARFLRH